MDLCNDDSRRRSPAQSHDSRREWFEHSHDNAWRLPYDTTLLSRRVLSELSYESHDDDQNFWKIENSVRGGYALSDDLAFGVQMMVPVRWIDSPASDESGIGDLELRSGFIGRFSNDLRWGRASMRSSIPRRIPPSAATR